MYIFQTTNTSMDVPEIELMCNDIENIYAVPTIACYITIIFNVLQHRGKLLKYITMHVIKIRFYV